MTIDRWIAENTADLTGRRIAITGATGGLGEELCRYLVRLKASLILLNRSEERSRRLEQRLRELSPDAQIQHITVDLEDMDAVRQAAEKLRELSIDTFIHNAGAYSIPRRTCSTGFDNVFQINFVSPYYLIRRLLPHLPPNGRVIVVGSIAHRYSKSNPDDWDFAAQKAASKAYGNAKRHLMFALYELFRQSTDVSLSVVHPGITFTNITAHYPPWLFAIIKYPMKILFMKPRLAALSILKGVFDTCGYHQWIGPAWFDVWGLPRKRRLRSCSETESRAIGEHAERMWERLA